MMPPDFQGRVKNTSLVRLYLTADIEHGRDAVGPIWLESNRWKTWADVLQVDALEITI